MVPLLACSPKSCHEQHQQSGESLKARSEEMGIQPRSVRNRLGRDLVVNHGEGYDYSVKLTAQDLNAK